MAFHTIGIVGLGLIGGSLGRLLVKEGLRVFAADTQPQALVQGRLLQAYTAPLTEERVPELDLLVAALYPRALAACLETYAPLLRPGCVVIDVGGNKRGPVEVMQNLASRYPHLHFIACHPMAGREYSGVRHSSVNLFHKASLLMVNVNAPLAVLASTKAFFARLGLAPIVHTTAPRHDRLIAYTSQLAHLVSNCYIKNPTALSRAGFSAGSFRDLTRVAKLNPGMWTELMMDNRDNLLQELDTFLHNLGAYRQALARGDAQALYGLLAEGDRLKAEVSKLTVPEEADPTS